MGDSAPGTRAWERTGCWLAVFVLSVTLAGCGGGGGGDDDNASPAADDASVSTPEDTAVTVTVTASDEDGDSLTFSVATGPANGALGAMTPVSATSAQVTYTPNADFAGADSFSFHATDGDGAQGSASVSITVTAVNDAPSADPGAAATGEDAPVLITLTGSDPDGDALTFATVTAPAGGTLSAVTPVSGTSAQVTYTPNPDTSGTDAFDFRVDDGQGATATATVTVTIAAAPDPVRAGDDTLATDANTPLAFSVLGNDADPDGDAITLAGTDATGLLGTLTDNGDGSYVYDPNGQFAALGVGDSALETFTYTVDSADGSSATATVRITVNGVNEAPVADPQRLATDEDTPLTITLTASDTESGPLTFSILIPPVIGTLGPITPLTETSAEILYTPDPDQNQADAFAFQATDADGGVDTALVIITVVAMPDPARAGDDAVSTDEDTPVAFSVLGNDLDPDAGDTIAFAGTDATGLVGDLTDNGDGSYTFDPNGSYEDLAVGEQRTATFTYTIDSSDGSSDVATVTITVAGVNDAPTAAGDRFGVENLLVNGDFETGDLTGWSSATTNGESGYFVDGDDVTPVQGDIVAGPADGAFYAVSDQQAPSAQVLTQAITVPAGVVSVVAGFDMFVQSQDVTVVNPAGLQVVFPNQQARVDLVTDPLADPYDTDAGVVRNLFTVEEGLAPPTPPDPPHAAFAYDLSGDVAAGGVYALRFGTAVTVAPLHHGVDNVRVSAGTDRDTAIDVPAPGVLGNDSDPDGSDVLAVTAFDALSAEGATVVVNPDGSYTYDPTSSLTLAALERGDVVIDTFTYTAGDGNGGTQTATVEVVVNGLSNDPPVADAQAVSTPEDTALDIVLTASDPDGDALTFAIATPPANGTLGAITPIDETSATVTYTPNADFFGADSFEFNVDDGEGGTATATVDIDVTPVNDPPTALGLDNASVDENEPAGAPVGTFTSDDVDSSAPFVYSLVAGAGDTDNASFAIVGDQLQTAAVFDFETRASYSVRVQTDDAAGGTFEQAFTVTVLDVNDPPQALGEAFGTATGNTLLAVGVVVAGEPAVRIAGASVLSNDSDVDGPNALVVASTGTLTSANGGTVEMNADGTFTYLPPAGFTGTGAAADTFVYTVFDGAAGSDATASIDVAELVWYFDDSAAPGGDGRSRAPLTDLPGAAGIGGAGDTLFVYAGTQTSGVTLRDGQRLIGEGQGLTVNALQLIAPGVRPTIADAGGAAVTLARDNEVRGLDIDSQGGVVGVSSGSVVVANGSITSRNGPALDVRDADNVLVLLDAVDATNNAADGEGITLVDNGGGSVTVGGTTVVRAPNGWALRVASAGILGSTFDFGAATLSGRRGALLLDNPGAEFDFASLDIDASLGAGLDARNNGLLTVAGTANTIDVLDAGTGGIGVRIVETALGDPGGGAVTFQSISSAGGAGGISLDTTGDQARFVVTGVGTTAESGGVLRDSGNGIDLNSVGGGVSFANIAVRNQLDNGIRGNTVAGFVLSASVVENNTNLTPVDEAGLLFDELTGTVTITDTRVSGSTRNNVLLRNTTGTLDLTVAGGEIRDNSAANGEDGLSLRGSGDAVMNATLTGVQFAANRGDDFEAVSNGNAVLDVTVSGGSMAGNADKVGGGINLTGDADLAFDIDGVSITGARTSAINVNQAVASGAGDTFSGRVANSQIGTSGVANSGSATGSGLRVVANGSGTLTIGIADNTIRQYNDNGIEVIGRDGANTLNTTITGNTLAEPAQFAADGLLVQAGATAADTGTLCAVVGGAGAAENVLAGAGGQFDDDFRVRQRFATTVRLPGYAGANSDTAAVVTFVQGNNGGTPSGSATEATATGGGGFIGTGAACP